MARLHKQLSDICQRNKDGSFATQSNRFRTLQMFADQLKKSGFDVKKMQAIDLKGRHVNALLAAWKSDNVTTGTIKNRMAVLRWWAEKINNKGAVKSNEDLGIERRIFVTNDDKGATLKDLDLSKVSKHVETSLKLQDAFGLRREEAMKFQASYALQGQSVEVVKEIKIKGSWAKGGRERTVPITNEKQLKVLKEAQIVCNGGSLIPRERSYKEHVKVFERETSEAGLGRTHGLRHNYAQDRYLELMGIECPSRGGSNLAPELKEKDRQVRQLISEELGHNRINITSVYLGSWSK